MNSNLFGCVRGAGAAAIRTRRRDGLFPLVEKLLAPFEQVADQLPHHACRARRSSKPPSTICSTLSSTALLNEILIRG